MSTSWSLSNFHLLILINTDDSCLNQFLPCLENDYVLPIIPPTFLSWQSSERTFPSTPFINIFISISNMYVFIILFNNRFNPLSLFILMLKYSQIWPTNLQANS